MIVLKKERFQLCVIDFLNKTFIKSEASPGRPLPPYRSDRVWFPTDTTPSGKAPAIVLSPTKVVKHPVVLIAPDIYGLTTTLLDAAIRFAREGFEVLLPDVGKTEGIGPLDHFGLRTGRLFGGGVVVDAPRVRRLLALYRHALAYLRTREMVDPARTGLFGTSYGATLALALAGEERRISALALAYPVPVRPADYPKLVTAPTLLVTAGRDPSGAAVRRQLEAAAGPGGLALEAEEIAGVRAHFLARDLRAYDLAGAERAWTRIVGFLKGRLIPAPPRPAPPPTQHTIPPGTTPPPPTKGPATPPRPSGTGRPAPG